MDHHPTIPEMIYHFLIHLNPWACFIGYLGGVIDIMNTTPNTVLAGIWGSGGVSIFLALCTIVGQSIGKLLIKEFQIRWKKYKNRQK